MGPSFTSYFDAHSGVLTGMRTEFGGGLGDYECQGRVDWPEPFECEAPVVTEVVCGQRFAVGDTLVLDPCISSCEFGAWSCSEPTIEDYLDYDATVVEWRQRANCEYYAEAPYNWFLAGTCGGGTLFISDNSGYTAETRFFDPETRAFVSLTTHTDLIDATCLGRSYWPFRFTCNDAIVTDVYCPTAYAPGDSINLP